MTEKSYIELIQENSELRQRIEKMKYLLHHNHCPKCGSALLRTTAERFYETCPLCSNLRKMAMAEHTQIIKDKG